MGLTTGFKRPDGSDVGLNLVDKTYLIDRYPELLNTFKQAGLWGWGVNSGNLGDNTIVNKSSPVQTISAGSNWKFITCGQSTTAGIKTDGTLWMWGDNGFFQCGDGTGVKRSSPVQTISGGTDWKQSSGGTAHTSAIKTDGTLWMWGENLNGQLGDGTSGTNARRSSPVQTISGGTNWKQVSAGGRHTIAIKTDGTLWAWGNNASFGALGDGTVVSKSSPVQTIASGVNWKSVSCGDDHTVAIKTDGTLWAWGRNSEGQLGDNTAVGKSSPVQTVSVGNNWRSVECGDLHTHAIKTDGTLWSWGSNAVGQLGDSTQVSKSSPVQTITGGTNWKLISGGLNHAAAIKTDGSLWLWGRNLSGELGDGTVISKLSPIRPIVNSTNWKMISCGSGYTMAIRDDSEDPI